MEYLLYFILTLIFIWYIIPVILLTLFLPFYTYEMVVYDYNNNGISVIEFLMVIVIYIVGMIMSLIPFVNYKFYKFIVHQYNMEFCDNRVEEFIVCMDAFDIAGDEIVKYLNAPIFKKAKK